MTVRNTTNKVLSLADEGLISYRTLAEMALKWMSEDDVAEMARANELFIDDEDDEEIEIDSTYHDCSEEELRRMGVYGEEDDDYEDA